jgi:ABC-2 type transport system permease protein
LPYYITIINIGKADSGVIFCGYLGLFLMSAAYIAIGIFASSITNNQIVAFLVALFIGIFFQVLFGMLGSGIQGLPGEIFNFLSLSTHFDGISRGLIDSRDLLYFISIVFIGLSLADTSLSKRHISD